MDGTSITDAGLQLAELRQVIVALDRIHAVSYAVDSHFRLVYCNRAWDRFARDNGAPQLGVGDRLGTCLLDVIPAVLQPFYTRIFQAVLRHRMIWQHVYECSSPSQFRKYRMRIHPLHAGGLLFTNSLIAEHRHDHAFPAGGHPYIDAHGIITMCAHCRCSRRTDNPEQWDFVPLHIERSRESLNTSHGMCPICRAYFYPRTDRKPG
jgi:hypothetical protein